MADDLKSLAAKARLVRAQLRSHGQQVEQINNPRQREILNTDLEEMHECSSSLEILCETEGNIPPFGFWIQFTFQSFFHHLTIGLESSILMQT
ncbi:unnamed protein product [Arabidopsis halleri]